MSYFMRLLIGNWGQRAPMATVEPSLVAEALNAAAPAALTGGVSKFNKRQRKAAQRARREQRKQRRFKQNH